MITGIYFLLLLMAAVEDYRSHTVKGHWVLAVWLLGIIKILLVKENRWVTLALTCICFVLLLLLYVLVRKLGQQRNRIFVFGGADVRLIPGMMLVQGWDIALTGVFLGLLGAVLYYLPQKRRGAELPLVPWMAAGCFLIQIFYLFFKKSMI